MQALSSFVFDSFRKWEPMKLLMAWCSENKASSSILDCHVEWVKMNVIADRWCDCAVLTKMYERGTPKAI